MEGLTQIGNTVDQTSMIEQMMKQSTKQANELMMLKLQAADKSQTAHIRQQLENMQFHADRAIANEESSRTLSSMFGKFSLVQKIMQNMG